MTWIHELRSIIDQPADGDENHDNNLHSGQHPHHSISSSIIGIGASHTGAMRFFVSGFLVFRPVSTTCRWLCQVHLRQEHPTIKALHGPPLSRFMLDGKSFLGYEEAGWFWINLIAISLGIPQINFQSPSLLLYKNN
jgi:hypothetical protein